MSAAASSVRVFSIPPGAPFLPTLVHALADGRLVPGFAPASDPLLLSEATIYVPTRRAARALEETLLDLLGRDVLLMPRIAPLGDVDEDALLTGGFGGESAIAVREAVDPLHRRLALARLIGTYAKAVHRAVTGAMETAGDDFFLLRSHPAATLHLADELAGLIDDFETEGVHFSALARLAPEAHDRYWEITLEFLRIAGERWPEHLAEIGRLDPSRRRTLLLAAEAERLAESPPRGPVIAAGSTGSIPATARLLAAVARLPQGAVVLPGLDVSGGGFPDAEDKDARSFGHPQFGLARLLKRLGVSRGDVAEIGGLDAAREMRRKLVTEAMRPASTTDLWPQARAHLADLSPALDGLTLVEAANEREEAIAIALVLRETLETPDACAALVTPDRQLARRVQAELRRWSLNVEDSAGRPLAETPPAILALLVAEAAASDLSPEALLPLLRHPLARFGMREADFAAAVDALEIGVLRGPAPQPGLVGLRAALGRARADVPRGPRARLRGEDWRAAETLLDTIEQALQPLLGLKDEATVGQAAEAQLQVLDTVSLTAEDGPMALVGGAGEMLAERLSELAEQTEQLQVPRRDWTATLRALLSDLVAPAPPLGHPRLAILGLLEARLLAFDRIVLGGLVEGGWPPVPASDPWLNRAFRKDLSLTPPERRIGLAAHDFTQALGTREVFLVRALRSGGQPTVPSRLVQRLAAFAGEEAWRPVQARGEAVLRLARMVDRPESRPDEPEKFGRDGRLLPPEPKPPTALRPAKLSVTEIETLLRDPYAVHARRVLKLEPLDPIAEPPTAADRGTVIHDALADFVVSGIDPAAPEAFSILCAIGKEKFGALLEMPDVAAVWWPRFERIARWYLDWERRRRPGIAETQVERKAELGWTTSAGRIFTLTGRADRLDRTHAGWTIVDYKTGGVPGKREVKAGLAPQLPLEGALLLEGGFAGVAPAPVESLLYVKLAGGAPAGLEIAAVKGDVDPDTLSRQTLAELKALIDRFENPAEPYRSRTRPKFEKRMDGDYDHLSRVGEWSATGGIEDGEAEE